MIERTIKFSDAELITVVEALRTAAALERRVPHGGAACRGLPSALAARPRRVTAGAAVGTAPLRPGNPAFSIGYDHWAQNVDLLPTAPSPRS